jgi:hypothetical protein
MSNLGQQTAPLAPAASPAGCSSVQDAVHALAQPLTALMFVLEVGGMGPGSVDMGQSLQLATDECRRALVAFGHLRTLLAASRDTAGGEAP